MRNAGRMDRQCGLVGSASGLNLELLIRIVDAWNVQTASAVELNRSRPSPGGFPKQN